MVSRFMISIFTISSVYVQNLIKIFYLNLCRLELCLFVITKRTFPVKLRIYKYKPTIGISFWIFDLFYHRKYLFGWIMKKITVREKLAKKAFRRKKKKSQVKSRSISIIPTRYAQRFIGRTTFNYRIRFRWSRCPCVCVPIFSIPWQRCASFACREKTVKSFKKIQRMYH